MAAHPEILVPLMVFGMPVAMVWISKHYRALERGHIKRKDELPEDKESSKRIASLEQDKKQLEARVENLESIVCSVDLELNARLNRLAIEAGSRIGPAAPEAAALPKSSLRPFESKPKSPAPMAQAAAETIALRVEPGRTILGRYHIDRELGRGGMGAVFLAFDAQLGEQVALKVMNVYLGGDGGVALERFRREASAARKITHPNVIRIHDLGEDAHTGEVFLSMEFFPGMTLAEQLRRRGALPLDDARELLVQICDGLDAAHRVGVVHRDLKPGNILINEQRKVKIIDFGLAKASYRAGMTATGLILGTPEYMAPEQVRGRDVDVRTDIYALGAVTYHMLTGAPPFSGDTPIAVGFAHCTQPVRPVRELRADVPVKMEAAVMQALAKEPRDRFDSVPDFRSSLLG